MPAFNLPQENRLCYRLLTAKTIEKMNTYNYAGFVGHVERKGDLYVVSEISGRTSIVGSGETIDQALFEFEKSVRRALSETAQDSQAKMIIRRFARKEEIQSRVNRINRAKLKRRVDRALYLENRS